MGITRPIAEHARRLPDETALIFEDRKASRRDLDNAVARIAAFIAARTPREGTVALDLPNGPPLAVLFLAVAAAGRCAQVFDCEWPATAANKMAAALKPSIAITSREDFEGRAIRIDSDLPVTEIADAIGAPAEFRRLSDVDQDALFYMGFTSGSTGEPKGYFRTHRSWLASFSGAQEEFEIGPADCVYAPGPFSHSLPLYALASALHAGAKFAIARAFHPNSALRAISAQRMTVIYTVPSQLFLMIEAAEAAGTICHGVRLVLCSGAKWPPKMTPRLKKVFPKALFAEFYGASELSFVTLARSDERVPKASVGRPFPGVTVSIRDPKGKNCAAGKAGLVFVEGPLLFAGYGPGAEDVTRIGDAVSVGDRGFLDKSGFLHLEGRNDRMLISAGRNIQPEEVEAALDLHPAVEASAVFGVADEKRGTRLAALIRVKDEESVTTSALTTHLRALLPVYKIPSRFGTVAKWPSTRSGKSDHAKLQKIWADEKYEPVA
jgi:long-chain acyl-CoA synthetase